MIKIKRKKDIRILKLRDITIAKVDYKGSFQGIGSAYKKLMKWSRDHNFIDANTNKTITIYHDDPNVVGINNVRQSACIIIDKKVKPTDEIKITEFKPGKCAVGRYELNSFFELKDVWMDIKNFVDNHELEFSMESSFEVYQPKQNNKTVVDICIPLKND